MEDKKKQAAEAALTYIEPNQIIGLGAGATIGHLVEFLKDLPALDTLRFTTSSYKTKIHLKQLGLHVLDISQISEIDLYFDSCDHYDLELNALKSGGGIHTLEKLLASMAKEFVLLVDESKLSSQITNTAIPLCIEILPIAENFVQQQLKRKYPEAKIQVRTGQRKDGAVITENGNMLLDVWFGAELPLEQLNHSIKSTPGVVEHSLFYHLVNKAFVAGENGVEVLPIFSHRPTKE